METFLGIGLSATGPGFGFRYGFSLLADFFLSFFFRGNRIIRSLLGGVAISILDIHVPRELLGTV